MNFLILDRSMQTFTTITGADYYETLIEDSIEGFTEWSISEKASSGDRVLFYVCRPVSAIVAVAQLADAPRLEDDLNDPC